MTENFNDEDYYGDGKPGYLSPDKIENMTLFRALKGASCLSPCRVAR